MTRSYSKRGDSVRLAYQGYPLEVGNSRVTVYDPAGRRLGVVPTVRAARQFVSGYRKGAA